MNPNTNQKSKKKRSRSNYQKEKQKIIRRFHQQKKKLKNDRSKVQKDFVDCEGLIKLYEDTLANRLEELKRQKAIKAAEFKARNAARWGLPYTLLAQKKLMHELRKVDVKKRKEFQEKEFKERARLERRRQFSRERRKELEENAWLNAKRNVALQRAEERAKTAELMTLLEEVCGHPAEETVQHVNECSVEDVLLTEAETVSLEKVNV